MRQTVLAVALAGLIALPACHKGGPKGGPPPLPTPPPVAPATPPPAPEPPPSREIAPVEDEYSRMRKMATDEIERMGLLSEIHFDYDRADIRDADRPALTKNADALKKFDFLRVTIEGHADERGTVEYNLALGERRAKAAHDYLVSLGVAPDRMKAVSYGKEVPLCQQSTEDCWARNRRDHFAVTGKARQ
jgi:peptidoglycan-associated lipoprotein